MSVTREEIPEIILPLQDLIVRASSGNEIVLVIHVDSTFT